MGSQNQTSLGLNLWDGTDRPKRSDFNSDNLLIDQACRGILESLTQHLEGEEVHLTRQQALDIQSARVHSVEGVATQAGMHGIRYYQDVLQVNVGGHWVDCVQNSGSPQPDYHIWGVCIDQNQSDPGLAVSRTDDSAGLAPDSPQWEEGLFRNIRACVVKDGAVQYYLDQDDYAKRADGGAADIYSGAHGDVMVEIPKMAYAIYTQEDKLYVKVTDHPDAKSLDERFCYHAHTRAAEGDRQKLYVGAYLGVLAEGRLRSLSGREPTSGLTLGQARSGAKSSGEGYDLLGFYPYLLLQCLYLVRYAHLDSQKMLGMGATDLYQQKPEPTGGTDGKGFYWGEATGTKQMKCMGIEDLYGNLYYYLDGARLDSTGVLHTAFQNFAAEAGYTPRQKMAGELVWGRVDKPWGTNELGFLAREWTAQFLGYDIWYCSQMEMKPGAVVTGGSMRTDYDYGGIFRSNCTYLADAPDQHMGARLMYL